MKEVSLLKLNRKKIINLRDELNKSILNIDTDSNIPSILNKGTTYYEIRILAEEEALKLEEFIYEEETEHEDKNYIIICLIYQFLKNIIRIDMEFFYENSLLKNLDEYHEKLRLRSGRASP